MATVWSRVCEYDELTQEEKDGWCGMSRVEYTHSDLRHPWLATGTRLLPVPRHTFSTEKAVFVRAQRQHEQVLFAMHRALDQAEIKHDRLKQAARKVVQNYRQLAWETRLSKRLWNWSVGLTVIMTLSLLTYFLTGKVVISPEWAVCGLVFAGFLWVLHWASALDDAKRSNDQAEIARLIRIRPSRYAGWMAFVFGLTTFLPIIVAVATHGRVKLPFSLSNFEMGFWITGLLAFFAPTCGLGLKSRLKSLQEQTCPQ